MSGERDRRAAPLEWRCLPGRRMAGAAAVVAVLFAALLAYAAWARDTLLAALVVLAAAYVLGPLLTPVRYRLDAGGLTRAALRTRRYTWDRFSRYDVLPRSRAVILRFAGGRGRLGGGVTLFLPDAETGDAVRERLAAWLPAASATPRP